MSTSGPTFVYIGTYSQYYGHVDGKGKGIYIFTYDPADGAMTPVGVASGIVDPAYLALAPNRRFMYSVNESKVLDGQPGGGVSAFAIEPTTGLLTFVNRQPAHGDFPCFLTVDATGSVVIVANHDGANTVAYPIQSDGSLGLASCIVPHVGVSAQADHPGAPHPHSVNIDSTNRFAIVCDKGLDQILVYRIDPTRGLLTSNDPPFVAVQGGTAPRHFAFHPSERFAFVTNEVGSTVTSFAFDTESGRLREINTVPTVPTSFTAPNHTADIRIHPNGKFVYSTNRGHDTVASFAVDATTGRLTPIGHTSTLGGWSRHIRFDPSGRLLLVANQNEGTIVPFAVDPNNGTLTPTGAVTYTPTPVCIQFLTP
jgi:6-phosphogluconolactonase